MTEGSTNGKITASHLARKAVVYLRQSSPGQVRHNKESTALQYALTERARRLGWSAIDVLDGDLGSSASMGAKRREELDRLVAAVARREVGVVLSREVSRLLRTDKDWCQLMEVCQVFDALVADETNVYDLSLSDDQLVLGIKGTLSVAELKTIRMRLQQGREAKASRGELARLLPVGYVYDGDGQVVKDPDQRVRRAIELVFEVFRRTWSIRQTFQWFHQEGVELPVNKRRMGRWELVWQPPAHSFVDDVLRNPWYAGAYVWGRRVTRMVFEDGRVERRRGERLEPEQCRVFLADHHEGYITWDDYEEHRRIRRRNIRSAATDDSVAAVRGGQGLLGGLLRCRRCGRRLHVRYWGRQGTNATYQCLGDYQLGGNYCLAFGGAKVDQRFADEVLRVVSPLGVDASLIALDRLDDQREGRGQALRNHVEEARYKAKRAFEQYNEVDPRHRLVAAELEGRWNEALVRVEELAAELAAHEEDDEPLSAADRQTILALGQSFRHVWNSEAFPIELKKKILHTLIEEVVVDLDEDNSQLDFVIHWTGGCHTQLQVDKPSSPVGRKTSEDTLLIIRKLAARYGDADIAGVLNRLGRLTGKGKRWNEERVKSARKRAKIAGRSRTVKDPDVLNLGAAAKHHDVSDTTIRRLVDHGLLTNHQDVPWAPWEIHHAELESEAVRAAIARLRAVGRLDLEGTRSGQQELQLQ